MDLSPLFSSIFLLLITFILVALLSIIFASPWGKGVMGEFIVNLLAKLMLSKKKYHLIKNVTLPTEDGTTQIDHVIVSIYGVFVVETKNIKGWIFGGEKQKTWTQVIFKHKNKFQNPLRQNYKHVKTLQSLLDLNNDQIHSVIVFVGDSTFKTDMPDNVTYGVGYIRHIKSINQRVLSPEDVQQIVHGIETGRLEQSRETNRNHRRHVNSLIND